MADEDREETRTGKRYGEGEGSWLGDAKRTLAGRMKVQRQEDEKMGAEERDRLNASRKAFRSGDYAPNERGGMDFKPFRPKRGE